MRDSFATSVLAALPVEADENGRVLVDASPLFLRDAADVEGRLRRVNQGTFRFDAGRSGFHAPRIKSFPLNAEVETIVTFVADNPGLLVNNITPDGRFFTLRIHHSFLKAPEGYTPRVADPRIGVSTITFRDFTKPFDQDTEVQWITRWRLEKKDPAAAMSEPKTPIVFYLDPGIPEPTRTAMRNGALWWNKAYEAAGFRNAVQVKDPTPDMDPMDIRYAWILWINRDERGFSSGGTFRDPRTGEILGSKTRMDSHRIRTIGNYFEAYTPTTGGAADDDAGLFLGDATLAAALAGEQPTDGMPPAERDIVLLRQTLLTAHELGHVMGFQHNFSSSLEQLRLGDGVSDPAREGDGRPPRSERRLPARHRTVRRDDGEVRLHGVPGGAGEGGARGRHPRDARQGPALRARDRPALVVVRRPGHAAGVPEGDDGRAGHHAAAVRTRTSCDRGSRLAPCATRACG